MRSVPIATLGVPDDGRSSRSRSFPVEHASPLSAQVHMDSKTVETTQPGERQAAAVGRLLVKTETIRVYSCINGVPGVPRRLGDSTAAPEADDWATLGSAVPLVRWPS